MGLKSRLKNVLAFFTDKTGKAVDRRISSRKGIQEALKDVQQAFLLESERSTCFFTLKFRAAECLNFWVPNSSSEFKPTSLFFEKYKTRFVRILSLCSS